MAALSIRLSDDLEQKLSREASLSGQPRSQLIREALETLLATRQRQRSEAALTAAARALAQDPAASQEALAIAADFLPAENEALARVEASEVEASEIGDKQNWWR
jgi:predicted transcriptional regulator